MKIYFAGSIAGGRGDAEIYNEIIKYLKNFGTVLTEHVGGINLSPGGERKELTLKEIHDRDVKWITECDILISEVSTPSLGVGYEIRDAIAKNKKILCLYNLKTEKPLSGMIGGSSNITNKSYTNLGEAKQAIEEFIKSL